MIYDELFSLKDGPICSSSLNGLQVAIKPWSSFLVKDGPKEIGSKVTPSRKSLDALSDADFAIISKVWTEFGHMTSAQIRKYTHDNCAEYTEVKAGGLPIAYREIVKALGDEYPDDVEGRIRAFRRSRSALTA